MALMDSILSGENVVNNYNKGRVANAQANYAPQTLAAQLQQAQLMNQFYPQIQTADINYKNAATRLMPDSIIASAMNNPMAMYLLLSGKLHFPGIDTNSLFSGMGNSLPAGTTPGGLTGGPNPASSGMPQPSASAGSGITGSPIPLGQPGSTVDNSSSAASTGTTTDSDGYPIVMGTPYTTNNSPTSGHASFPSVSTPASSPAPGSTNGMGGLNMGDPLQRIIGNYFTGLGKSPMFGSNRSAAGGTFMNPNTGEQITSPTNAVTTQDQKAILAVDRVTPLINDMIQKLPQFQNFWTRRASDLAGVSNDFLGSNYQLPSEEAMGKADIKNAAEGLINAWGLRPNDAQVKMMQETVEPIKGESPQGYTSRLIQTLKTIEANQNQAKGAQAQGISLTPKNNAPVSMVTVKGSDGSIWTIPESNLATAIKRGGQRIN